MISNPAGWVPLSDNRAVWPANLENIKSSCLFCRPDLNMQQGQILLGTDNFFLFAGIGPIVEGYIIIAPRTCDWKKGGLKTLSEAPCGLLDELLFLQGIVFEFYRTTYGHEHGLCFEHGRAGTCGVSDTPHCYHAHLCCFPVSASIWADVNIRGREVQKLSGLSDLGAAVGQRPYLLIENRVADAEFPGDATRFTWEHRVVVLESELEIERQYLRKLLARRVDAADMWDWAAVPDHAKVTALCDKFGQWLHRASRLTIRRADGGEPNISFREAALTCNTHAYDAIAPEYHRQWPQPSPTMARAVEEFGELIFDLHTRRRGDGAPRVLDIGCGTGTYLKILCRLGVECIGTDASSSMLNVAAKVLAEDDVPPETPPPQLFQRDDAFDLSTEPDASCDGIWCSAVMVHLPRRFALPVLRELRRVVRPGGVVYLSAQSGGDAVMRSERRFFVYYSEAELEGYFASAGLRILKRWHDRTNKGSFGHVGEKRWMNYFLAVDGPVPASTPPQCRTQSIDAHR